MTGLSYAGNDRDRYEPPACSRCGRRPEVEWCDVGTYGKPDQVLPGVLLCRTPGCVDDRGSNRVPKGVIR